MPNCVFDQVGRRQADADQVPDKHPGHASQNRSGQVMSDTDAEAQPHAKADEQQDRMDEVTDRQG
jgi:hypothetical protein